MNNRTRIEYIDLFKSIGIILMIMGHIKFGDNFDYAIHAFHMPMFFWISGYLFTHRTREEISSLKYVGKKARALLLPYLVFGLLNFGIVVAIKYTWHKPFDISPLVHLFTVNTEGLKLNEALWFLTALFFTNVLFFFIDRYIGNRVIKAVVVIVITLAGLLERTILPFVLPLALGPGFVGVGLFYAGFLFKKYSENKVIHYSMNLKWYITVALGVVTGFLLFLNGYINMRLGTYANIPLFLVNAILSIIVLMNLARLLYSVIKANIAGKFLTTVGKNSIVYLCLNQIVIYFVSRWIGDIKFSNVIVLLITMLILWVFEKLFVNTKMKFVIGR